MAKPSVGRSVRPADVVGGERLSGVAGPEKSADFAKPKNSASSGEPVSEKKQPADSQKLGEISGQADNSVGQPEQVKQQESEKPNVSTGKKGLNGKPLSSAELGLLVQLQQIDMSVRSHEQAHLATAGSYARSAASFSYARGPDGRNYAVGGEVQIDTSPESRPEQTISKMMVVRSAALAPADPSPQDRQVAAQASVQMVKASQEISALRVGEAEQGNQKSAGGSETEGDQGNGVSPTSPTSPTGQINKTSVDSSGRPPSAPESQGRRKPVQVAYRHASVGTGFRPAVDIMA